jgi:deazaflavin-dependent oxidoreductase (nitroreductase family)
VARQYRLGPTRRAVNTLVAALARRGLGSKSTALLTTTGARSGLDRTTPVIPVEIGGHRYVVSPYGTVGWVHNVRASGEITLSRGRQVDTFAAEEVDAGEAGPVLREYLSRARVTAPFFDAKRGDPVDTFVAEAARHPVFRLTQPSTTGAETGSAG